MTQKLPAKMNSNNNRSKVTHWILRSTGMVRNDAVSGNETHQEGSWQPTDLDALFQQHWTSLCRVLFRMVGDSAEAEDLALDAFVQLYQRPPRDAANLGGWLYRVATRLGLNSLRARRRRQQYEEEAGIGLLNGSSPDPAMVVEDKLERDQVRETLARMKPRSAQLILMRYSGLSYAELAEALDVSPGSIGTLLVRAEKEFEEHYETIHGCTFE